MEHSKEFNSAIDIQFRLKYTWMQNLILTYNRLYKKPELHPDVESILFTSIKYLICLVIAIIEELPYDIFKELKEYMIRHDLLIKPEIGTDFMKILRFIEKFVEDLDPKIENRRLDLLFQKNVMFVELGFVYVSDTLLSQFVI